MEVGTITAEVMRADLVAQAVAALLMAAVAQGLVAKVMRVAQVIAETVFLAAVAAARAKRETLMGKEKAAMA